MQLSDGSDIPFEQIAAQKPYVIIAVFSGIDAEQYARLSQIAPTVAYPDQPWSTPWQDVTRIVGEVVGKPAEAEQLVTDTLQFVADEAARYPEIAGTTFAGVNDFDGSIAVYDALDARMKFLTDTGLVLAPSVTELEPALRARYNLLPTLALGEAVAREYGVERDAGSALLIVALRHPGDAGGETPADGEVTAEATDLAGRRHGEVRFAGYTRLQRQHRGPRRGRNAERRR